MIKIDSKEEKLGCNIKFTSQIFFCPYCLSLDLYKGCPHKCAYCFAQTDHGEILKVGMKNGVKLFSFDKAIRYMNGENKTNKNYLQHFIEKKQPLHIGGMADPFPYGVEEQTKHALSFIKAVKEYPCIFSTKNPPLEYAKDFAKGNHIIQFSSIGDMKYDARISAIEPGLPDFTTRFKRLKRLKPSLQKVIVRFQPFIPFIWNYDNLNHFLDKIAFVADAVTIEFLKKPVAEKWGVFSKAIGFDIGDFFKRCGTIDQTDKVFDVSYRYEMLKLLKKMIKDRGMEFYSAENYFRDIGDGPACCGISEKDGDLFQSKLTYCLNNMLFKAKKEGSFCWDDIEAEMPEILQKCRWVMGFDHVLAKSSIRDVLRSRYNSNDTSSPVNFFANIHCKKVKGKEHFFYEEKEVKNGFNLYLEEYDRTYGNGILKQAKVI